MVGFPRPLEQWNFNQRYVSGVGRWAFIFIRLREWEHRMFHKEIIQVGHDDGDTGRLNPSENPAGSG